MSTERRDWTHYALIAVLVVLGIAGLAVIAMYVFLTMAMSSFGSNK